jgi:hypothetical protein
MNALVGNCGFGRRFYYKTITYRYVGGLCRGGGARMERIDEGRFLTPGVTGNFAPITLHRVRFNVSYCNYETTSLSRIEANLLRYCSAVFAC